MKKKAIVVEDDVAIQDVMRLIIEGAGYAVEICADGRKIADGGQAIPDIFLIDKQLPGIDGLDVCRILKSNTVTAEVPVIILSASPYIRNLADDAGADAFIEKPFSKKVLLETMASLLYNKDYTDSVHALS